MAEAVECIWPVAAELGEGPFWSAAEEALWFVDIKGNRLFRFHEPTGERQTWDTPPDPGFVLPTRDGRLVVGLGAGLHFFDKTTGDFTLIQHVEPNAAHNRLNDGFVDAEGYLWFGSMDDNETDATGALYQLVKKGECRPRDKGYVITNGPCTSPDGRTLYHTDTLNKVIYAFTKKRDGALSDKRVFAEIADDDGYPDGPICDSHGTLWTGLFGGWGLNRYTPAGELVDKLKLPVANVTKQAFGGRDLRSLYITTARKGLTAEQRAEQPLAGGLFRVHVDVPGLLQGTISHGL